jgi:hypothetical protein
MRGMEACPLHLTTAQVESTQICLSKIAVGEIDVGNVHFAKIDAAQIAAVEDALFTGFPAPIEFVAPPLP